nr:DnaJ domain-containing protein [Aquisalinus flavus]
MAILIIIAAISGIFLLPPRYTDHFGIKLPRPRRTQRLYQGVFIFALILIALYLKIIPFALILGVIGVGLIIMDRIREALLDNDDLREDTKPSQGGSQQTDWRPRSSAMEPTEAYSVLGLKEGASVEEVDIAYKRLIGQLHPDRGGTDYLAAKLNEARDVLKKRLTGS